MSQLSTDCINEILEYLEDDGIALFSCVLVNRLWCQVSVRILWRSIRNYVTLIGCLPKKSKKVLRKNNVLTSILNSNNPIFNYASFCKKLSFHQVNNKIEQLLKDHQPISSQYHDNLRMV